MERYWCSETRTSISPREKEQQKILHSTLQWLAWEELIRCPTSDWRRHLMPPNPPLLAHHLLELHNVDPETPADHWPHFLVSWIQVVTTNHLLLFWFFTSTHHHSSLATASCSLSSHGSAGCVKSWGWPDQLPTSARLRHLNTCMMIMKRQIQAMFEEGQNVEYNTLRWHQLSNSLYSIVLSILIKVHHCLHFDHINAFNDTNLLWSSKSGQVPRVSSYQGRAVQNSGTWSRDPGQMETYFRIELELKLKQVQSALTS